MFGVPKALLSIASLLAVAASPLHSQILADFAADYQGGTVGSPMTPLADTNGAGTWLYASGTVNSDSAPTSVGSLSALTYEVNVEGGPATDLYGTTNDFQIPAVANGAIFGDGSPNPPPDYLAVHPNGGTNAVVVQWTAGAGETGNLTLNFDLSRVGVTNGPPGLDDFTVFENGTQIYQANNVATGVDLAPSPITLSGVTPGTTVDFVVSASDGGLGFNMAYLEADISAAPEPSTWAMFGLGALTLMLFGRRLINRTA